MNSDIKGALSMRYFILSLFLCAGCNSELDNKPSAAVSPASEQSAENVKEKVGGKEKVTPPTDSNTVRYSLSAGSSVEWVGSKITKDHSGGFTELSGTASVKNNGELSGFNATVEIKSMFSDSNKLTSHLLDPDFLDLEKFKQSTFTSTEISKSGKPEVTVKGIMEMHGVKNEITFPALITKTETDVTIKAEFKINRQLWGISYPGRPDDLIKDDILLKISLNYGK